MSNALVIASSGLRIAERAFTRAASDTMRAALPAPPSQASPPPAAAFTPPLDMASGIVAQMEASLAFRANLAVYRVANGMYRALLDATAGSANRNALPALIA